MWRYNVSEHGDRDAVAVCCFVSDRMVFRIDVDAGFDPSFSPDKEDTICAEQSLPFRLFVRPLQELLSLLHLLLPKAQVLLD